jgi:hypothetical protein
MKINRHRARNYLENFDFKNLFVEELGWGRAKGRSTLVGVNGQNYQLTPLAELGGMVVYACEATTKGTDGIPPANIRKQIDKRVSELAFEHIIIFVDRARTKAVWLWVKREAGKPAKPREQSYQRGQPGELLLQKLAGIAFDLAELDDEGQASIATVSLKVARAFDVERVTRRFYDEFKVEHDAFLKFIKGVDDAADRAWYTSVMLNRLMFIYFIQQKGFLDGDPDYLKNRLAASQKIGANRFYRDFLTRLFFDGFAREKERPADIQPPLGHIPYLNGGLFMPHQLEQAYGQAIQISDAVFERLFGFFDRYTWHLDDRPLRADNEINPDVLGYIFEKYINQKQMGAYYTKEDITGYICRNTILPCLFDKLGTLRWQALHPLPLKEIEPYIYPAVKQADMLPTETTREYATRQKRLQSMRADFAAGKIASVNDLITYNLDIERFAQDWLRGLADPLTLRAFYFECLSRVTVLDPTVGSGAFLFAAMNILEPLYEICLDKMVHRAGPKYPDFKAELERVAAHPNRRYFIFKSIIVNNLFGVDIMEEATEICKLRLFLKLVAQVDEGDQIEPLPDIDFNIRAGNSLVGYASLAEVEQAAKRSLFNLNLPQKITEADVALRAFRALQTQIGISGRDLAQAKADTQAKLAEIEAELNEALRLEYGARNLNEFTGSHHPFHWYVEFNQIMQDGGFDVIVGNPPYVEYNKVRGDYQVRGYHTESSGNLYAFVMERSFSMMRENGYYGMIVPAGSISLEETIELQSLIKSVINPKWISSYGIRPSKLFEGVDQRLSIILGVKSLRSVSSVFTTKYILWNAEERPSLFALLEYVDAQQEIISGSIPKTGHKLALFILQKLFNHKTSIGDFLGSTGELLHYHRSPRYWIRAMNFEQYFKSETRDRSIYHFRDIYVRDRKQTKVIGAILNSSLFYFWFVTYGNGRNITGRDIVRFPFSAINGRDLKIIDQLFDQLMSDYKKNSVIRVRKDCEYQEFNPSLSKPIMDEIDQVLARHYGFTEEELDFIINYDIKYRMGKEGADE